MEVRTNALIGLARAITPDIVAMRFRGLGSNLRFFVKMTSGTRPSFRRASTSCHSTVFSATMQAMHRVKSPG